MGGIWLQVLFGLKARREQVNVAVRVFIWFRSMTSIIVLRKLLLVCQLNSGSGTGSTQSREHNWGATWKNKLRLRSRNLRIRPYGSVTLTMWHPLSAEISINFANKQRSLGRNSSLADSDHGVFFSLLAASLTQTESRYVCCSAFLKLPNWLAINSNSNLVLKFSKNLNNTLRALSC
jgi:hypothetical protein